MKTKTTKQSKKTVKAKINKPAAKKASEYNFEKMAWSQTRKPVAMRASLTSGSTIYLNSSLSLKLNEEKKGYAEVSVDAKNKMIMVSFAPNKSSSTRKISFSGSAQIINVAPVLNFMEINAPKKSTTLSYDIVKSGVIFDLNTIVK